MVLQTVFTEKQTKQSVWCLRNV